jgi:transcription elongation factor GreB
VPRCGVSKAFTKDDSSDAPLVVPARAPLPDGVINYVTPRGLSRLHTELGELQHERLRIDVLADDPDRARALASVIARLVELEDRLAGSQLVDPTGLLAAERDVVRFGARVVVRDEDAIERVFRIVGIDEAEVGAGRLAFVSPVARALLGKRVGEVVTVSRPRGEEDLEIVAISYGEE